MCPPCSWCRGAFGSQGRDSSARPFGGLLPLRHRPLRAPSPPPNKQIPLSLRRGAGRSRFCPWGPPPCHPPSPIRPPPFLLTSHKATCSPLLSHCPGQTDPASCLPLTTPVPPSLLASPPSAPDRCPRSCPGPHKEKTAVPLLLGRVQPQPPLPWPPWGLLSSRPGLPVSSLHRTTFGGPLGGGNWGRSLPHFPATLYFLGQSPGKGGSKVVLSGAFRGKWSFRRTSL